MKVTRIIGLSSWFVLGIYLAYLDFSVLTPQFWIFMAIMAGISIGYMDV